MPRARKAKKEEPKKVEAEANEELEHNEDFDAADAGSSATFPLQASALRKNGHVMINCRPCKIADMSTSKTGKHGHAKINMVAYDIFTGKKLEALSPSTHNMDVPNVSRKEYQVMGFEDDHLNLMTDSGDQLQIRIFNDDCSEGIKLKQQECVDRYEAGDDVQATVLRACGEEMVVDYKMLMA